MYEENRETSNEVEWMLQSSQVDDELLAQALLRAYYGPLLQLGLLLIKDEARAQRAACLVIRQAVNNRHNYSGEIRLKVMLLGSLWDTCRKLYRLARFRRWLPWLYKEPQPVEAVGISNPGCDHQNGSNPAIAEAVARLTDDLRLPILLRYVHDLSINEIAWLLRLQDEKVMALLNHAREKAGIASGAIQSTQADGKEHQKIHEQIRSAASGVLDPEDQAALDIHLSECSACRIYAQDQAALEAVLKLYVPKGWATPDLHENECENLLPQVWGRLAVRGPRKARLRVKELSLSMAAIILVGVYSWYGRQASLESPASSLNQPVKDVVIIRVTPKPVYVVATQPVSEDHAVKGKADAQGTAPTRTPSSSEVKLDCDNTYSQSISLNEVHAPSVSGPLSLGLVLQYWDWDGDNGSVLRSLMPISADETVMPYEMLYYVEEIEGYEALHRMGGDIYLIKRLVQAGFPVIVAAGGHDDDGEWVGQYLILCGYDNSRVHLIFMAPSLEKMELTINDKLFEGQWRPFNYTYLVVYPDSERDRVMELLGPHADYAYNLAQAAEKASREIFATRGVDHFYAWFNRGTSLAYLDDYGGAAKAYDEAFVLYEKLPKNQRPWRMMWYQTRPYWAYYYTARYQDVIELANRTLLVLEDPSLEESYYWRALAREALGDLAGATTDLIAAQRINPNSAAVKLQLDRLRTQN